MENLFAPTLEHKMFIMNESQFTIRIHPAVRLYMTCSAGGGFVRRPKRAFVWINCEKVTEMPPTISTEKFNPI